MLERDRGIKQQKMSNKSLETTEFFLYFIISFKIIGIDSEI